MDKLFNQLGFKQTFLIKVRINHDVTPQIALIRKIDNKYKLIAYNLDKFKISNDHNLHLIIYQFSLIIFFIILAPKFYLNYDASTFKEAIATDEHSFVENYISCITELEAHLIQSIYPVFRKQNENVFKKFPKLIKPLNDDYNGYYKCRLVVKNTDGSSDTFETNERYLEVIENESRFEML